MYLTQHSYNHLDDQHEHKLFLLILDYNICKVYVVHLACTEDTLLYSLGCDQGTVEDIHEDILLSKHLYPVPHYVPRADFYGETLAEHIHVGFEFYPSLVHESPQCPG